MTADPHRPNLDPIAAFARTAAALLLAASVLGLPACAPYGERVAPVPLPERQSNHVNVGGALITARPYVDARSAKAAFGFDIRGAGVLPVRFVIDNQSGQDVRVLADQTFLIDQQGQAWPLLTYEQAYNRIHSHVEVGETLSGAAKPAALLGIAGAVAGLAIGVVSGHDVGGSVGKGAALGAGAGALMGGAQRYQSMDARIREDLSHQSLRNTPIGRGELAYGYLFFPGKDEARTAVRLRLGLLVGGERHIVDVPL